MSLPTSVAALLDQVNSQGTAFAQGNNSMWKDLLKTVRSLYLALETPIEAILRMEWAEMPLNSCMRVAIDIRLFDKLKDKGEESIRSQELAKMTETDPKLLKRILRHLASMGVIRETDIDSYSSTPLSNALTQPKYRDGIPFCFDVLGPAFADLPKFLSKTEYKNPEDSLHSAFQSGHNTSLHLFEYLAQHLESQTHFNNHMLGYTIERARWTDPACVPIRDLLKPKDKSKHHDGPVLLVDIAGGIGRDITAFREEHSDIPGRLVLQELPEVINQATELPQEIELMVHDMFTRQPIQGAQFYYLHSVLHDWPDEKCREILRNIIPSMTRGYSKILINENVIPDRNAHWKSTGLDLVMMSAFSSTERTEAAWRELLASVGLSVIHIWTYEEGTESLIEAELSPLQA
ncbi:S-adenosyl-L-methionine-dependent methyltransferase [Xylogone sp. PMI_703]|nr:S-adenosyl-L-methionine-dependent methyltransferase [Xylogone sp. PMI_703]